VVKASQDALLTTLNDAQRSSPCLSVCNCKQASKAGELDAPRNSSQKQQHSAADDSNPLHQPGILHEVLSYVGPGHWLFLAKVSSLWRDMYLKVNSAVMSKAYSFYSDPCFTCTPKMTLYSAVFASPAAVQHAHACGLKSRGGRYEFAAGLYADTATLSAAHELGMPHTAAIPNGAALAGAASKLHWLCTVQQHELNHNVAVFAALGGNVEVFELLQQQGCAFSAKLCSSAASFNRLPVLQYLRSQDCPWTAETTDEAARSNSVDCLRWARDNGCPCDDAALCATAAKAGSVDVLAYLQEEGLLSSAELLSELLLAAGACKELAAAQWLRAQGAAWPAVLRLGNNCTTAWSGAVLEWARAEGCTAPTAPVAVV
jgi:hypothetical protein